MAKHRERREESRPAQGMDNNQLMNLLGNVDLNQLSSLLGGMSNDGFNINSINNGSNKKNNNREDHDSRSNDKDNTVQMLRSLRGMVAPQKVKIIDKIIEMYLDGEFDD